MVRQINKRNLIKYGLLSLLLFFLIVNILNDYKYSELCMIISLLSSVLLIYKSRNEIGSTFIFLFLFLSLLQISPEYLLDVKTTAYSYFYNENIYNISIAIIMVYITFIAIFFKERRTKELSSQLNGNNNLIFVLLYIGCIYILLFGINRGSYTGYTVSIKTIYEYFVMVYCFAYYYSNKSTITKILLLLLALVYILQDFYYGGRISSFQIIILIGILFFNKLRLKSIIVFSVLGYILMNFIAEYRVNYSISGFNFTSIINSLFSNPVTNYKWNTFSEVLYSSGGLVYSKLNIFAVEDTTRSFIDFIINIFIGGERHFGNIVSYIDSNISNVGGGGFLPVYFYFWTGWVGVIIISWITTKLLNFESNNNSGDYHKIAYILLLAMFPRWYLYTPLVLFRFLLLNYTILYISLKILDKLTKRKD